MAICGPPTKCCTGHFWPACFFQMKRPVISDAILFRDAMGIWTIKSYKLICSGSFQEYRLSVLSTSQIFELGLLFNPINNEAMLQLTQACRA